MALTAPISAGSVLTVCGTPANDRSLCARFADLRTSTCKQCNPGFYAPSSAGNRYCVACPVNT
jgi:hypothetical protein